MKTIQAEIPEPVLRQAQELANRENIPLRQLMSLALTQVVGMWSHESYVALRARDADQKKFVDALNEVPDVAPPDHDKIPDGYERP